jgi:hypothetical protein
MPHRQAIQLIPSIFPSRQKLIRQGYEALIMRRLD